MHEGQIWAGGEGAWRGGEAYKQKQAFARCSEGFGVPLRVLSKRMRQQAFPFRKIRDRPGGREERRHREGSPEAVAKEERHEMLIKQIRKVTVGMKTGLRSA